MKENPKHIHISEYNYPLPDERIAKFPLPVRDQSKLLVYRHGEVTEDTFTSLPEYLPKGSLMIFNNTKVIQARLHFRKETGALIEASMMIGAVLAGADADTVEKVGQIGQNVGMAFQIQDDILDVTGDEAVLGKPTKSDEKNHKITYVSVKGLDQARKDVERYSKEAVRLLEELPCENEFLHELILNLISRDA